jgi:uncharacterized protein (DUF2147 family)
MRGMRMGWGVVTACAITCAGLAPAAADPVGVWRSPDGGLTRIAKCGAALCGTIVSTVPANDLQTGRPQTDKKNPDSSRRNRPLVGVMVLIGMQPNGPAQWSGQLYNPDDGQTYAGKLIEQGPTSVRVEGCGALGLCGGEDLTRTR